MIWRFNNKKESNKVLFSLTESEIRLFLIENNEPSVKILKADSFEYENAQQLSEICSNWVQQTGSKGLPCYWLLARDLYKVILVKKPNTPDTEVDAALKWLIKDQLEQPLEQLLVTHYLPLNQDPVLIQAAAVVVEKDFIENLIQLTDNLNLDLHSIEISELTAGYALQPQFEDTRITGLIDEDKQGLVFNFYVGADLAFTRHIKRRYFPQQGAGLSLEDDDYSAQLERFLLEIQRTIDYCVSQIFRRPIDKLVVEASKLEGTNLIQSIEKTLDIAVTAFDLNISFDQKLPELKALAVTIDELGIIQSNNNGRNQYLDLYLPQYRPQPLEFGFNFAASVAALFLMGFILLGLIDNSELAALNDKLKASSDAHQAIQSSVTALQKKLKKEGKIIDLNKIIVAKQKELTAVKRLLVRVNNQTTVTPVAYSKILKALSKLQVSSLWLTKINLYPTSINLTGQTTKAQSIPEYINSMSQDKLLSSQFEDFSIERDPKNKRLIHFKMVGGRYNHAN